MIVSLEHINLNIPDKDVAGAFYLDVLGGAAHPPGPEWPGSLAEGRLIWANFGLQQIHLPLRPTEPAQLFDGAIALFIPASDVPRFTAAIASPPSALAGTKFHAEPYSLSSSSSSSSSSHQLYGPKLMGIPSDKPAWMLTCPWGNTVLVMARPDSTPTASDPVLERLHPDATPYGRPRPGGPGSALGIPFVEVSVKPGTALLIGQFYMAVFGCDVTPSDDDRAVAVSCGPAQTIVYTESATPDDLMPYAGWHVACYLDEFDSGFKSCEAAGVVWANPRFENVRTLDEAHVEHQYRFKDIVHVDGSGEVVKGEDGKPVLLVEMEHEVRELSHIAAPITLSSSSEPAGK